MSASVPCRRIAAHLLWTPGRIVRNPLVELGSDGRIRLVTVCTRPDCMPCTEFYAGMLVPDFPTDFRAAFEMMRNCAATPLPELLAQLPAEPGVPVVLSGLDYRTLRLTPQARIQRL